MSFVNRLIDQFSSEDVIDLYFVLSDLRDIPFSEREQCESAHYSTLASARAQGIHTQNGHAYDAQGNDLGPIGKLVL